MLVSIWLTSSCLDKFPVDAIPEKDAITTIRDADQAAYGIYATFKNSNLYSGLLTLLPDIQADLVYAIDGYTNKYGEEWRWETQSTNTDIKAVYGTLYQLIGRCNFLIEGVDKIQSTVADEDYDKLMQYKGEAHFARALAYSELVKLFCKDYDATTANSELGVILISSYSNAGELLRATLQESYDFILQDLDLARELLDDDDATENVYYNQYYFTKYTVESLYARVCLFMDDADGAIEHATNVIESGQFALASTTEYSYSGSSSINNYQYMWMYDSSEEVIWRIGFQGPSSFGGAIGSVFMNYRNGKGYTPDYVPATWVLNSYSSSDLRKPALFQTLTTSHTHGLSWPLLVKYYGNRSFISNYNLYHVCMPKVFRLSELYLIRAEAYAMHANYAKASEDITILRKARYQTYSSASVNVDTWLDVIEEERVKELYMEGFRLNDLKRWGKGFKRKSQANSVSPGDELKVDADDPLFVWPIPKHEIDVPGSEVAPNDSNN